MASISALAGSSGVHIFSDALNHASLIDGCRLAVQRGARLQVFRHLDYAHLAEQLAAARRQDPSSRLLVVTDGVFSMDGDVADVQVRLQGQ